MTYAARILLKTIQLSVAALFLLVIVPSFAFTQEKLSKKPKAVSLDYCADQFILSLADPAQIMALTTNAIQAHSFYRDKAQGLPLFLATSEEVLHMNPDIVIRNWGGFAMLPLLRQAHIPVAQAQYGIDSATLYQNLRRIGAALDQSAHAEEIIQDHKKRQIALQDKVALFSAKGHVIRAAYIAPGGITAGQDTFINNIIKMAGLKPISEELGLIGWQPLPLEAMINNPPDVIIGSFFNMNNIHISNWSLTRHSRIKEMLETIPTIMVPGSTLSCDGIFSIDAAEYIHSEVERLFK